MKFILQEIWTLYSWFEWLQFAFFSPQKLLGKVFSRSVQSWLPGFIQKLHDTIPKPKPLSLQDLLSECNQEQKSPGQFYYVYAQ